MFRWVTARRSGRFSSGWNRRDCLPVTWCRSLALSGKHPLTTQMAQALHANLGIPADVLLQQPGGELPHVVEGIDWKRFPLAEMAKRGWIEKRRNLLDHAEEIMRDLIARAGGEHVSAAVPLCRHWRSAPTASYRKNVT
jgi:HTH-type transcriptional regulator / antitoxin HigA